MCSSSIDLWCRIRRAVLREAGGEVEEREGFGDEEREEVTTVLAVEKDLWSAGQGVDIPYAGRGMGLQRERKRRETERKKSWSCSAGG